MSTSQRMSMFVYAQIQEDHAAVDQFLERHFKRRIRVLVSLRRKTSLLAVQIILNII